MREKLIMLLAQNFDLIKSEEGKDLLVEMIYQFYIENGILNSEENVFYYGEEDKSLFDIHYVDDTKNAIKNDIESIILEADVIEDEPSSVISYGDVNYLIKSLQTTLEQYDYFLSSTIIEVNI